MRFLKEARVLDNVDITTLNNGETLKGPIIDLAFDRGHSVELMADVIATICFWKDLVGHADTTSTISIRWGAFPTDQFISNAGGKILESNFIQTTKTPNGMLMVAGNPATVVDGDNQIQTLSGLTGQPQDTVIQPSQFVRLKQSRAGSDWVSGNITVLARFYSLAS